MKRLRSSALASACVVLLVSCARKPPPTVASDPWSNLPPGVPKISIVGSPEDERAVRSFIHYLFETESANKIGGPFGNSNSTYNGHIFWDTDVWILPAVLFLNPVGAKAIADSRIAMAQIVAGKCRYPWEADELGNDVTTGPTKTAEHQSGDVMLGLEMAVAHGLVERSDVDRIGAAVARHYLARGTRNESGGLEIRGVTGVDEWFVGDNCLYTNAVADWTIKRYLGVDPRIAFPRNARGELVTYQGDPERAYQQAAAALVLWPLEREDLVDDPIAFVNRFVGKESKNGPAMSLSVYALIHARHGNADDAYKLWADSWKKYTDGNDLLRFSERPGRKDLTYFSTGAAGCLNAVIYGFMGAKLLDTAAPSDSSIKMSDGRWLVFRPNLPSHWKSVTFENMWINGKTYDVTCTGKVVTVRELASP